jgi:hypothetical protein
MIPNILVAAALALAAWVSMLGAQLYAGYRRPHPAEASKPKRYPKLRQIAVRYNRVFGLGYLTFTFFAFCLAAFWNDRHAMFVVAPSIVVAAVLLSARIVWRYL